MEERPEISEKHVVAFNGSGYEERNDTLAVESSLAININARPAYYCMRTPGMDRELAVGLCYSDGRIKSYSDILNISVQDGKVDMELSVTGERSESELKIIRSSAGIIPAGTGITAQSHGTDERLITAEGLFSVQDKFFSMQNVYEKTGATHAAGIFSREGALLAYAEDVGRHNALDKCIGRLLLNDKLSDSCICMLSSRLSYEMVLKGVRARIRLIAGVSAPTSFAVDLANESGITLIGFMRKGKFNIYSGQWRVKMD